MKCPRCVQRIHRAAESCPHCGFSMSDADEIFGSEEIHLKMLTDAAGLFRLHERDLLDEKLHRLLHLFPQLFFSIYTGNLGQSGQVRQLGFWLLNRGIFQDVPPDRPNANGILLVIDPDAKMAGISFGYLLDPYFDEADSFECLSRAHAYWLQGGYAEGALRVLLGLEKLLKKRSRDIQRERWNGQSKKGGGL